MSEREREALNSALWAWYAICIKRYSPNMNQVMEQMRVHHYELHERTDAN